MPSILDSGSSALLAFQRVLSTVSHNVANAATPGYSRQNVVLASRPGQFFGSGFIGAGVQVVGVQRSVDRFITARSLDSGAELGRLTALASQSARIDRRMSDVSTGPGAAFSSFFDSAQGVSSQPASGAARQEMLSRAQSLVARFRSLDSALDTQDRELSQRIRGLTEDVNGLTTQIARLNVEIVRQQGMAAGQPANDLLDQRDLLISQLNAKIGVTTVPQDDGALNVFASSGQSLVIGNSAAQLRTTADPYRPDRLNVALDLNGDSVALSGSSLGGELGGLIEFRAASLDPAIADLGKMATALAHAFNQQHRAGMDFYGQRGGDFFVPIAPQVLPHSANSGGASLITSVSDVSALNGADLEFTYNAGTWTATDARTRQAVAMTGSGTPADPFLVGGMRIEVAGPAANGDRFLVQPSAGAAGQMRVALSDPNRIAAALPIRGSADLSNLGNGSIANLGILDPDSATLLDPVVIEFIDAANYTVNGSGPFAYSGSAISANGWELQLGGTPVAGDRFRIAPNSAGSSDNGNARLFSDLDERSMLSGGTVTLNSELGRIISAVGSSARQAQHGLDGQAVIDQQLHAEQESISGVNLDEEAANLLRFQQSYQAAAQVISVADSVFQSLLAAVRR
jgi:flagellar hook-associated protein 1